MSAKNPHVGHSFMHDLAIDMALFDAKKMLGYFILVGVFLCSMYIFRSIKKFVGLGFFIFIAVRFFLTINYGVSFLSILQLLSALVIDLIPHSAASLFVEDILGLIAIVALISFLNSLLLTQWSLSTAQSAVVDWGYRLVKNTSFVKKALEKEQFKIEQEFDKELKARSRALGGINKQLPEKGWAPEKILKLMKDATAEEDKIWENGRISGAVYFGKHNHIELLNEAFGRYSISNPLHADVWPSVMKFESEIISMTAALVNGGNEEVCGCTTSGGTESIILAIKAHRDYYFEHHGIHHPEMVACVSAHAAVDKGCDLMGIKLTKVPMDPVTYQIDLCAVKRVIGPNTILIYASAPSYAQGAIDPIDDLGQLAVKYNCGLHVDCCLGGFVLPFAKRSGYHIPDFDFSVTGVSSMSLDTHKFGYALKGSSVVLYRSKELRHAQYFCYADWTGGMYSTPTIAGSRSGGLIAQCWASLMALGYEGYAENVNGIMTVSQRIAEGIKQIQALELCGYPQAMVVCFRSTASDINIYSVGDHMTKRGWSLNALQHPACLHICCTVTHIGREDEFLSDLRDAVLAVQRDPAVGGNAAIYGMTSALPSGPVNELLKVYNDVVLKC